MSELRPRPTGPDALIDALETALGAAALLRDPAEMAPYLADQRGWFTGRAPVVVSPASTAEVSTVLRLASEAGVTVVPQGGNTGLVGGSIPDESGGSIVLSLRRMNRVREVDPVDFTITVEAGCVLAEVQTAAREAGLLFPLSLAAEGSCRIGGNLATNAGGTAVLRYGNTRDLVLGLEVVLADGRIWEGLRRLRKDNTGYKLAQLFVGSEGTLGVITAAVLRLFPMPREVRTALLALRDPRDAGVVLEALRSATGDAVTSFEYMNRASVELALEQVAGNVDPFDRPHDHYLLVELSSARQGAGLLEALESVLAPILEDGGVVDAVLAQSGPQAEALWRIRETIPEAQRLAGAGLKHDVSVPLSRLPELLERGAPAMLAEVPGALVVAFGHFGDGNVHFNLNQPPGMGRAAFMARREAVEHAIYELVAELEGSFGAEHGIGRVKRAYLTRYRPAVEVEAMRRLKRALDPAGILNPGVML
jgi:FAD/FMN-containing dehydrogenase